jgi:predicted phage terminase large subunit-like protein
VWLPHDAPWLEPLLHELTTFPKSAYDDQVDSVAQALAWMTQGELTPVPGVYVL